MNWASPKVVGYVLQLFSHLREAGVGEAGGREGGREGGRDKFSGRIMKPSLHSQTTVTLLNF